MKRIFWGLSFLFFSACFGSGVEKTGSVLKYQNGIVKTVGNRHFKMGALSSDWKQKKIKERAVIFINSSDQSSITVSSWCGSAFDDAPLKSLADQLYNGFDHVVVEESVSSTVSQYVAHKISLTAQSENQPLYMRAYVLKAKDCVYDFLYVASPQPKLSRDDFESFVQGFELIQNNKKGQNL